jgi:tyrosyl-tRNA synthetase
VAHFRTVEEQLRVIRRGTVDLVQDAELVERLERSRQAGKPLRVKLGIDPSSADIHVGHTVVLRKLRDFQRLGHKVIVLWGTATAMVGDPSGRDKTRPTLTRAQVHENKETYRDQIGRVLEIDAIEERENGEWFESMDFMSCVVLASRYTVAQILDRDSFQQRYSQGVPISVHEMLYPLMQGWDSVQLNADVEVGGTDQLFNLIVGRELQKQEQQPAQVCLTVPLLEGLDGTKKMSKSLGNYIGVTDAPAEMFGKSMSIPDSLMEKYFTLLTDVPDEEIRSLLSGHPREAKIALARTLVASYWGEDAAEQAQTGFDRMFREGGLPDQIPEVQIPGALLRDGSVLLAAALASAGLCATNSEGRRLIQGGGVRVDGETVADPRMTLTEGQFLLQLGKRKAARVAVPPAQAGTAILPPDVVQDDPPEKE